MSVLAIIPARGGSKRIPRKNVKMFCGKPIICYSIEAALNSGVFDEVMVSTDDEEIASVARQAGAVVPFFRSPETANDHATISDVIREVLNTYRQTGKVFDTYAIIYATAPMIRAEYLRQAYGTLRDSGENFLLPVVKFSYPPQRSYQISDGLLQWTDPRYCAARSQDLEPWYHDCGLFSFGKTDAFFSIPSKDRKKIPLVLDESVVQDIDTEEDWHMAEMKYKLMNVREGIE